MSRILAIGAALGFALAATAGSAMAAPSVTHTATKATTVQSSPIAYRHGGDDGDCDGVGNQCA
ncbi:hypothetical protein [Streptomyces sp. NPDC001604]|uniref:hypothetical protein n=1 Tax=Streptomyces sp. NPDC001604 TaxID=3364593 RepID=UPI0036B27821